MVSATKDGAVTVIGGGDTVEFLERYGFDPTAFTFVSTGGGAMLEFISGKKLPAIEALRKP
jgi:phosphoglycerate kinase